MDIGLLVVRLLHIILGAFWVGAIMLAAFFVMPAIGAAGPEGAKVAQGLQQRGLMKVMPVVAVLTLLTGFDLLRRASSGFQSEWFGSGPGMGYSTGMLAAVLAFLVGFFFMRPLMNKAQTLPPAEAQPLRVRALMLNRVVAVLLIVATGAMAVARYL